MTNLEFVRLNRDKKVKHSQSFLNSISNVYIYAFYKNKIYNVIRCYYDQWNDYVEIYDDTDGSYFAYQYYDLVSVYDGVDMKMIELIRSYMKK